MTSFSHAVHIDRPVAEVWDYVTDRANLPRWFAGVVAAEQDGPNQVGTRTRIRFRFMGVTSEAVSEVTVYEPRHRFAFRSNDLFPFEETEVFTPAGGGTLLEYQGDYTFTGAFRLARPLVVRMVRRQVTASYTRLKQLLEARERRLS